MFRNSQYVYYILTPYLQCVYKIYNNFNKMSPICIQTNNWYRQQLTMVVTRKQVGSLATADRNCFCHETSFRYNE